MRNISRTSRKTTHDKRMRNTHGEANTSFEVKGGSRNVPTVGGKPRLSQEDISSHIKMEKGMERLLTVFNYTSLVSRNATSRRLICTFEALAANGAELLRDDDKIRTYVFFHSGPARVAYETFIEVIPHDEQTASIIVIACTDAWMNCFIEDLHQRLKVVGSGSKEPHLRKTIFNALLLMATANIKAEFLYSLQRSLPADVPC